MARVHSNYNKLGGESIDTATMFSLRPPSSPLVDDSEELTHLVINELEEIEMNNHHLIPFPSTDGEPYE